MAVVLLIGMSATALALEPLNDDDAWFSDFAGDGGLWTTPGNWWRGTAPTSGDVNGVGHDAAGATLTVNSGMGNIFVNSLWVGDFGPGPWGKAYFTMESGLLVLEDELMIGHRPYEDWGNPDWANWGNGSVTILGGQIAVGGGATPGVGTLGIGSTFANGVGGIGELHIRGGAIRAEILSFGVIDSNIPGGGSLSVDIAGGKLLLPGNISSLDARVTASGGARPLVFDYEADLAGYTTITPEPATVLLLGLGGLVSLRRKRRA